MTESIKRKWGGYGGECGGVWRSVEECGGVWRSVE